MPPCLQALRKAIQSKRGPLPCDLHPVEIHHCMDPNPGVVGGQDNVCNDILERWSLL